MIYIIVDAVLVYLGLCVIDGLNHLTDMLIYATIVIAASIVLREVRLLRKELAKKEKDREDPDD